MVTALEDLGHDVSVAVLRRGGRYDDPELLAPLRDRAIDAFLLERSDGDLPLPPIAVSYEEVAFARNLQKLASELSVDGMFLYTARAAAATVGPGPWPPRLAFTVDLDHLARLHRIMFDVRYGIGKRRFLKALRNALMLRRIARHYIEALKNCEVVVGHAANHCEWLRKKGLDDIVYLPQGAADVGGGMKEITGNPGKPLRLMTVGAAGGIATASAFPLLGRSIVPALHERFEEGIELHVIGSIDALTERLVRPLKESPIVKLRGYVDDLGAEFRAADALLVPTPLRLGFRTRIAEAFSYGMCVIAHTANAAGMPELKHGHNVFLADTGADVADVVGRLIRKPELGESIGRAARRTFEEHYDARVVCERMVGLLERSKT